METKIQFIGIAIPSEKEVEILPNNEMGLIADVVYIDGKTSTFNNLTEIHWMYSSPIDNKQVAFESNVHGTGLTINIERIKSLKIQIATEVKASFSDQTNTVIGYQVLKRDTEFPELHDGMDASFCVYSLSQAKEMRGDDEDAYVIEPVSEGDIEEPTLMFSGDPNN